MAPSIASLVSKPFGPYLDSEILSQSCKKSRLGYPQLEYLQLRCGDADVGFDKTEFFDAADKKARVNVYPVLFRGVLTIKSLEWLSPLGHERIQTELRHRDIAARSRNGLVNESNITPEDVYNHTVIKSNGEKEKILVKVLVQGEKNMFASFLIAIVEGLLLPTKDRNRNFEVVSLHVLTTSLSRKFFERYRLLALLSRIAKDDPKAPPLDKCSVAYFVDRFLAAYANPDSEKYHRLIFDPDDSDVDAEGNTRLPRQPRHVPRAEVLHAFALHAEWILAEQLAKKRISRVIDVHGWKIFVFQARRMRREAGRNGYVWGRREGQGLSSDEDDGDNDEDALFENIHIPGKDRSFLIKAAKRAGKDRNLGLESTLDSDADDADYADSDDEDRPMQNVYDSDFSEDSTPPVSPSSDEEFPDPINPDILEVVPPEFWHRPDPPGADYKWRCPIRSCTHVIDMLDPREDDIRVLPRDSIDGLRLRRWERISGLLVSAFLDMVDNHYESHLKSLGIERIGRGTRNATLRWKNPRRHPPWPRTKDVQDHDDHIADAMEVD